MSYCNSCASVVPTGFCPTCGRSYNPDDSQKSAMQQAWLNEERARQQAEINYLRQQAESLRQMYVSQPQPIMTKPVRRKKRNMTYTNEDYELAYKDRRYFDADSICKKHENMECDDCAERAIENRSNSSLLPAIIAQPRSFQSVDKIQIKEDFEDKTEFIKKALNLNDEALGRIKVKDVNKKMAEAQEQITVGQMKELLKERIKMPGIIQTLFRWFAHVRVS